MSFAGIMTVGTMKGQPTLRWLLLAASANNVAGGLVLILWPNLPFQIAGLASPLYPELVQCTGMLVGAFGLAYGMASMDPLRHWPVVLSGLLTKILSVAGAAHAAGIGRLPWSRAWLVVLVEAIWWLPFGLILKRALDQRAAAQRSHTPDILSIALRTRTTGGHTLEQLSQRSPLLVVFLRHAGCTFCREALSDVSKQRRELESSGVGIVLVHMSDENYGRKLFARYGLEDVPQIANPGCTLYRAFGLKRGSLLELLGPSVWWRGFQAAILRGHGVGPVRGDAFQMPGIFLIFHGHVLRTYRHRTSADRPDYAAFAREEFSEPAL